ncbi:MAG TPA: S-layer homology domain-containing protein [Thermoanaerobaculia bacterium]|nr:S-layer homology domain-containing protein [Thermoanaerobaculia bacterium]
MRHRFFPRVCLAALAAILALGAARQAAAAPPCSTSPSITSLDVVVGPVSGGTAVKISGSGFCDNHLRVFFGAAKVASPTFNSSTSISVSTPASAVIGPVNVRVSQNTTAKPKQSTLTNGFTYTCDGCKVSEFSLQYEGVDPVEQTTEPNGVLEPGESSVAIKTTVVNGSGVSETNTTGAVTNLTGPQNGASDIVYTMNDSAATYGTIPIGGQKDCGSDCYAATITIGGSGNRPTVNPADTSTVDWDATMTEQPAINGSTTGVDALDWRIHVGQTFTDVPLSNNFYGYVERLVHNHVTFGTDAVNHIFSPSAATPRRQMAAFIARGFAGGDGNVPSSGTITDNDNANLDASYDCSNGGNSLFADISPTDPFCRHIHYIAGLNVTTGCPYPNFCGNTIVTRAVMSVFISRTLVEPLGDTGVPDAYGPDPNTGRSYDCTNGPSPFPDVALGGTCKNIAYIWALGIVDGFGDGTFKPNNNVTRGAMSKFLDNAFQLTIGPASE